MLGLLVAQLLQAIAPPSVRQFELDNGLSVVLREDRSVPLVSVNLCVRVGSANEEPGRTGLAHLFEHLMFKGTRRVPDGMMDDLLEAAGGSSNATTSQDYTTYFSTIPSNFLSLALWIEADRLATLLESMSQEKLDNQREVVRNERRQTLENRPYGTAELHISEALFPAGHPYRWPVIGTHEDLQAASLDDVRAFFRRFYVPNNMTLVLAGDLPTDARDRVERYFGGLIPGPDVQAPFSAPARLEEERRIEIQDRVQLPRVYVVWPSPPSYAPGDAEMDLLAGVLAGGKSSRLYRRLVYDERIAQDVEAMQISARLGSVFQIVATAKPGRTPADLVREIDDELARLRSEPPTEIELRRARNQVFRAFYRALEHVEATADLMNRYVYHLGTADSLDEDLDRYRRALPEHLLQAANRHLGPGRVVLTVVPR